LRTQLHFASGSLSQYLAIDYLRKFPETTTVKADDPEKVLFDFIPPSYSKVSTEFHKIVEMEANSFVPIGKRVGAYSRSKLQSKGKGKGKASNAKILPERPWTAMGMEEVEGEEEEIVFVAYEANWETPGFKEYHRKMQIFVLLYIEGAQYIDEEDGRWEFITL
jgi:histone acetyltransferase 1